MPRSLVSSKIAKNIEPSTLSGTLTTSVIGGTPQRGPEQIVLGEHIDIILEANKFRLLITSYLVKLRNSEYNPGPTNSPRKPSSHGSMNR